MNGFVFSKSKFFKDGMKLLVKNDYTKAGAQTKLYVYRKQNNALTIEALAQHCGIIIDKPSEVKPVVETDIVISKLSDLAKSVLRAKAMKHNKTIYELSAEIINQKCEQIVEEIL